MVVANGRFVLRVDALRSRGQPPRNYRRDPLGTLVHQVCCPMCPSVDNFVDTMNRLAEYAPRHAGEPEALPQSAYDFRA
jgi:hypothetical protein